MLLDLNGASSMLPLASPLPLQKLSLSHRARLQTLVYVREEAHPDELWQSKSDLPLNIPPRTVYERYDVRP
jgi:hypothetical protein